MKAYQRLFLFLLASLVITVLLSPWIAVWWDRFAGARPALEPYRYSFSRIFDRCFLVSSILLFFPLRRFLKIGSAAQIGFAPRRHARRDIVIGFFCALGSMAVLLALMWTQGLYTPFFRLSGGESASRIFSALMSGLMVGLLEETFFRGIFFKEMVREGNPARAFLVANLLYAAVHFIEPEGKFQLYDYDPLAGFRYLMACFKPFLDFNDMLPGFIGLFCIGLVLSYAVFRTNTLYLSIGLHAGWVFSIKTVRVWGDYTGHDLGWIFGSTSPKVVSGVAAWLGILTVGLVVHVLTRRRIAASTPPRLGTGELYGEQA